MKAKIFWSLTKPSLVSRWIALYSYYKCVKGESTWQAIVKTLKNEFPQGEIGREEKIPIYVFSHAGFFVKISREEWETLPFTIRFAYEDLGIKPEEYFILEIDNRHGINMRPNDITLTGVLNVRKYFNDELTIYEKEDGSIIAFAKEFDADYFPLALMPMFVRQNRAPGILGLLKYDWGDILSFLVPFIKGSRRAEICSEFVYKLRPDIGFAQCGCELPSPNDLFYSYYARYLGDHPCAQ